MPAYSYNATDLSGKILKGKMDAADEIQLKDALMRRKLYLISCEIYSTTIVKKQLSKLDISDMCRQLGSMLQSGISVVKSMEILLARDVSPDMKIVLEYMHKRIKLGNSLSDVMRETGAFPQLLVSMMEAGEASGNTENILQRMALYYENEHKTTQSIKSALTYPAFLAVLLVVAVIAVFTFIIPNFISIFDGMELPFVTQVVLDISNFLTESWYILIIAAVAVAVTVKLLLAFQPIKVLCSKLVLRMGKIGRLVGIVFTARFCRTFSELYASGLPIIQSMQIARNTIGSPYIEKQFDGVIKDVRQGVSIAEAVSKVDGFDGKLKSSILVGEESGRLEFMLTSMAESFEFESDQAVKKLTGLIEPVMIVSMGVLVAFVFVAVMLPMFSMYDTLT